MKKSLPFIGLIVFAVVVAATLAGCGRKADLGPVANTGAKAIQTPPAVAKDENGEKAATKAAPVGEGWGSIKGRILVEGKPAALSPLVVNKDAFCIAAKPENDALIVGKDGGLANAVVYLWIGTGAPKVAVHPDHDAKLNDPVVLNNKGCMFHPHVFTVRNGQSIEIKNLDPVGHNTNMSLFAFNQLIPAGPSMTVKVSQSSTVPMPVQCNIHPWMKGYVLSLDHPYAAVTGEDGTFEIKNIPSGEHDFQFWHEFGYLKSIAFKGGKTDAKKGRAKLTIIPEKTLDLGDMKVPADNLKQI